MHRKYVTEEKKAAFLYEQEHAEQKNVQSKTMKLGEVEMSVRCVDVWQA